MRIIDLVARDRLHAVIVHEFDVDERAAGLILERFLVRLDRVAGDVHVNLLLQEVEKEVTDGRVSRSYGRSLPDAPRGSLGRVDGRWIHNGQF